MRVEIRRCGSREEFVEALAINHYFGGVTRDGWLDDWLTVFDVERMHGAFVDGRGVAGAGAFSLGLSVPGGDLPAAGVTVVGVLPTHRRRGLLRTLMRAQLDDVRERGEPLAVLWASEAPIYRRYGYGLASLTLELRLPRERTAFRDGFERRGEVRLVAHDEALAAFPGIYERVRGETPGMVARSEQWWRVRRLVDYEWSRRGGGALQHALLDVDGRPEGYALYRLHFAYTDGAPSGHVAVVEAMGATPQVEAEVWRFLLDIDWMARIEAGLLPVDHPLLLLLSEPQRGGFRTGDGLWLRLVDVGAALSGRAYAADGELVLDVRDAFCPWNEGRWRLAGGACERTEAEPDLRLDAADLASAYLGGFTFGQLARSSRVEELRASALARADGMFRSARAPWCPEIF